MRKFFNIENLTLLGIILGILTGYYFPGFMKHLKILGDVFLGLLKMIIIPLVFTSVLVAIIGLGDISRFKNIGIKTIAYYLVTTTLAVLTGLILVNIIQPGKGNQLSDHVHQIVRLKGMSFEDIVWNIIPTNPIKSFTEGKVLQIIFLAIIFGLALLAIGKGKIRHVSNFFDELNNAFLNITKWIIRLTPVGVFSLVGYIVATMGMGTLFSLWKYVITVISGLIIHAFLILPFLGLLFGRYNPYKYFVLVREAALLAFSTASSAATLPVSMQVAEEKGGIEKEIAGFVLPLGATINMDGTALYESVAAVFIANVYGIGLSFYQMMIVFLTATLASIGAAAIPGAGLVMLALVLSSVGIPLEGIGLIIAVDRFLDMLRTSVNVWGDLNGAKIINRFIKE